MQYLHYLNNILMEERYKMRMELNKQFTDFFPVTDGYNNFVTGLSTSFTGLIIPPSGLLQTGLTITEIGSGLYRFSLTPNLTGTWGIEVREPTHFPWGKQQSYVCDDSYTLQKRGNALAHENFLLTGTAYNVNGKLTSAKMYTYEDSGFTIPLAEYNVVSEYAVNGNPNKYQVKKV